MSDEHLTLNEQQEKDWVRKLRYSRSFLSKLILSDNSVKEYYAAVATKLLSYDRINSRFNWSGVNFVVGRTSVAKVSFSGKTLCLYLAVSPKEHSHGRYRIIDVSKKKTYAFTPSKLKIRSAGALKAALNLIDTLAEQRNFSLKDPLPAPILAKNFPSDTFDNLLTRGLVRRIVEVPKTVFVKTEGEGVSEVPITEEPKITAEDYDRLNFFTVSEDVYKDTVETTESLISRHDEFAEILSVLKSGVLSVNLSKKFMLKMIDETWVKAVEDSIPALDEVVRTPSHFIEETEEVLPIERTKKVTSRSLIHLSQHTDLISRIDKDNTVTPSKLLNVFRDDSIMTYENKFVNTLLNRLLAFVTVRYNAAVKNGANEKVTALDFEDTFVHGAVKGRIRLEIELTDTIDNQDKVKNYAVNTDLWKRVRRLYEVVRNYQSSELVMSMGKTYIRPPVMRTNPILKNKNLRQCLALWEFIESYTDEIGIIVDEKQEDVSEELLKQVYNGVAEQYLVFCRNVAAIRAEENDFVVPRELSSETTETTKKKPIFDYTHGGSGEETPEPEEEDEILFAVDVAIAADSVLEEERKEKERKAEEERRIAEELKEKEEQRKLAEKIEEENRIKTLSSEKDESEEDETEDAEETEETSEYTLEKDGVVTKTVIHYRKSFAAKLSLSSDVLKEYYCAVRNKLLCKDKVKLRTSFACDTFTCGRKQLAKITVVGKSLRLFVALSPADIPAKFFIKDVSETKKYAQTPAMMKIKSARGLKNALLLIDTLLADYEDVKGEPPFVSTKDFPRYSLDKLVAKRLAFKTVKTVTVTKNDIKKDTASVKTPSVRPAPLPFKSIKTDKEEVAIEEPEIKLSEKEKQQIRKEAEKRLNDIKKSVKTTEPENEEKTKVLKTPEIVENAEPVEESEINEPEKAETTVTPVDMTGAGGDALVLKQEVVDSISETVLDLKEEKPEETPAETIVKHDEEVPVGGDALLLKPITLADLDKSAAAETVEEEKEEKVVPAQDIQPQKKNILSRIFKRKK